MNTMKAVLAAMAALVPVCAMAKPKSHEVAYQATLGGDTPSTRTGSKATGAAKISVDKKSKTVDLEMRVTGITIDQLWDSLVAAPVGPIHFHIYGSHDHGDSANSALVLPVPFGSAYAATEDGFTATFKDYPFAQGAALVKSDKTFEEFVAAMDGGLIVLNIHTDAFQPGEISGGITPVGRAHRH